MASSGSFSTSAYTASDGTRNLTFSWEQTSQSVSANTTTISWKLYGGGTSTQWIAVRNVKLIIAGETVYSYGGDYNNNLRIDQGDVVATGSYTFTHNADGSKSFTVSAEAGIFTVAVNCNGSQTFTLNTIPRKSTMSVSNGTLGVSQQITVTKQASAFTHTIRYAIGSDYWTIANKSSATSFDFTMPLERASYNTSGTSLSVAFTIITYNGSTEVGSNQYTRTFTIPISNDSLKPGVTVSTVDPTGHKDTYGYFVKGLSKCKVTVGVTQAYGSAVASCSVAINGVTYSGQEVTTGSIIEAGSLSVSVTVKDKRGATNTWSGSYDAIDYSAPYVSAVSLRRCDENGVENDQGNFVMVTFSAAITALRDRNTASYKLEYKKSSDTQYTAVTFSNLANVYTVNDASYIFSADSNFPYDVSVTATDRHSSHTRSTSASSAFTLMNWHKNGRAMGIGMVSEDSGLAVGLEMKLYGGIESVANDKAKSSRLALGIGKHLWGTGDWSSSNSIITVEEIQNYTILRLKVKGANANILAYNNGGNLRGIGGYAENNQHRSYAISAVVDGSTVTMTVCNLALHTSGGSHSTIENVSISDIWGII